MTEREGFIRDLVEASRDFCLLIEHVEHYKNSQWLEDVARILPRLQTAMTHLDNQDLEYSYFCLPDLAERFELYCKLKDKLGGSDPYPLEYDRIGDDDEMTGSLASDFADIYFELSRGLRLCDSDEDCCEDALTMWQTGYILVWGERLVNAQKQLFSMRIADRI